MVDSDQTPETDDAQTEDPQQHGDDAQDGKGSKTAVLADLAKERDKRQAAEQAAQETNARLEAVLAALGQKDSGQVDPEQLARDLSARDTELVQARRELAVLRAATGVADGDALLDSRAFLNTLTDLDPSDMGAVKAHVTDYVAAHPRFAATPSKPAGVRDAAAGPNPPALNSDALEDILRRAVGAK